MGRVKVTCKAKITGFKADLGGYSQVMRGAGADALMREKAEAVMAAATAAHGADPGEEDPYALSKYRGRLANGYVVKTRSIHAQNGELRHNTLRKSLGSAR